MSGGKNDKKPKDSMSRAKGLALELRRISFSGADFRKNLDRAELLIIEAREVVAKLREQGKEPLADALSNIASQKEQDRRAILDRLEKEGSPSYRISA